MEIRERIVNKRRHTVGYVIGQREFTRKETVNLVTQGKVHNARLVNSKTYGKHVMGKGLSLYELPIRMGKKTKQRSR